MLKPTVTLGPFPLGVNNRLQAHELPPGALRDAVNTDIDSRGKPRRRQGYTLQLEATDGMRSLWSNGARGFFADGDSLFEMTDDARVAVSIATGLAIQPIAYAETVRGIAFSDGQTVQRVVGAEVLPIALERPAAPTLSYGAGSMPGGRYQVACSYRDARGEESGLSLASIIDLPNNSTLVVALPAPADAGVTSILVYATPQNGDQLYLASMVDADVVSVSFPIVPEQTIVPVTRFMQPLPPGDLLAFFRGRTLSHANGVVSFTDPWSGLYHPATGFLHFPAPVSILHPTDYGLFIVADETYLLENFGPEVPLKRISPMTAVAGTLVHLPDSDEAMWFTPQGFALTRQGGLSFIQDDNVAPSFAERGAAVYRETDGRRQSIVSLQNPSINRGGASAWFSATIVSGETRDELAT